MNTCALLMGLFTAICGAGIVLIAAVPQRCAESVGLAVCAGLAAADCGQRLGLGDRHCIQPASVGGAVLRHTVVANRPSSALFLAITAWVFLCVSVFCAGYLPRYWGRYSLRSFGILYLALYASIVAILAAGDVLLFLLAWEVMSILTYLLVNYEHEEPAHTQAGYAMLAFSEAGTLAAALGLLVLAISAGAFDFASP